MKHRPRIYLAGPMENADDGDLGSLYRDGWAGWLQYHFDAVILNPCEFEPEQLKGLRPNILPEFFEARDGRRIRPKHWHEMKNAKRYTSMYKRFKTYMQRIIEYDTSLFEPRPGSPFYKQLSMWGRIKNWYRRTFYGYKITHCLTNWTKETAMGAGTHGECTLAYLCGIPLYTLVEPSTILPGWIEGCSTKVFDEWDKMFDHVNKELGQ